MKEIMVIYIQKLIVIFLKMELDKFIPCIQPKIQIIFRKPLAVKIRIIAAVLKLFWAPADPAFYRIHIDVSKRFKEIFICIYRLGKESAFKNMSESLIFPVIPNNIPRNDMSHCYSGHVIVNFE